jgi:hypothetical protein
LDAVHKYVGYEIPVIFAPEELFAEVIPFKPKPRPRSAATGRPPSRGRGERRPSAPPPQAAPEGEAPTKKRRRRRKKQPAGDGGGDSKP